jgi:hypothetical protein
MIADTSFECIVSCGVVTAFRLRRDEVQDSR